MYTELSGYLMARDKGTNIMKHPSNNAPVLSNRARELRTKLARKIAFFIGPKEKLITDVPGLLLSRRTAPTAPATATYEPSLAVVAQGRKRATLAGTTFIFDQSRYLLTSLDLPVICNVIEASEDVPYLCFVLKLEMPVVRELLSREERAVTAELVAFAIMGLKSALKPAGFNVGANLGSIAGAGFADHLHWHVVPRWEGDANFMPVIGSTRVLSQHLEESFNLLEPLFKATDTALS